MKIFFLLFIEKKSYRGKILLLQQENLYTIWFSIYKFIQLFAESLITV